MTTGDGRMALFRLLPGPCQELPAEALHADLRLPEGDP